MSFRPSPSIWGSLGTILESTALDTALLWYLYRYAIGDVLASRHRVQRTRLDKLVLLTYCLLLATLRLSAVGTARHLPPLWSTWGTWETGFMHWLALACTH